MFSSFQVQILWFLILLVTMYILISYKFLPNTLFSIKIRENFYTQKPSTTSTPTLIISDCTVLNHIRPKLFFLSLEEFFVWHNSLAWPVYTDKRTKKGYPHYRSIVKAIGPEMFCIEEHFFAAESFLSIVEKDFDRIVNWSEVEGEFDEDYDGDDDGEKDTYSSLY